MILLPTTTIAGAVTAVLSGVLQLPRGRPQSLAAQGILNYGSGGTSIDLYLQTTFDAGTTWFDIANWHITTAALVQMFNLSALTAVATANSTRHDAGITANTSLDGFLGTEYRVKYTTVGTYAGLTNVRVDVVPTYA